MTKSECRAIFKQAWYKAIQKDIYSKHIIGSFVARAYFMSEICMLLFPENNIADQFDFEAYEKAGVTQLRATKNDFKSLGILSIPFEEQELTNVNKGDLVFLIVENPILLKKLSTKIINYLYMGDDLLLYNMGCVINWAEWKLNIEYVPRLLFYAKPSFDTSSTLKDGKQFRPHGDDDKLIWNEFWSKV
jgi:hypothetical protein